MGTVLTKQPHPLGSNPPGPGKLCPRKRMRSLPEFGGPPCTHISPTMLLDC